LLLGPVDRGQAGQPRPDGALLKNGGNHPAVRVRRALRQAVANGKRGVFAPLGTGDSAGNAYNAHTKWLLEI